METITSWKKEKHLISANLEDLENSPKLRHEYINGNLWIAGVGLLYNSFEDAEKSRDKKFERPYTFYFFNKTFYANVPKYNFNNIIKNLS